MVIAIALSALCSMLEATLLSTPLSFVTGLEEQGIKGAQRLKRLKQNPDRPISAILCLNTIANTVGASIVGSLVFEVYGDALVGIFSTIFTFAILIFSEIIPKTVGANYWRSLAIPASAIINMMIFCRASFQRSPRLSAELQDSLLSPPHRVSSLHRHQARHCG